MDTTEVTEREWKSLLGKPPHESHGDTFPVVGATWYQAMLYANAKSRRDGLRPVYSYFGIDTLETRFSKTDTLLDSVFTGLVIDMTANGYRLPTEAEFEYAARAASDIDPPGEIDTLLHPAAFGRPNAWGIYNLLDNANEWVNDGYDENYYSNSILENPYGHDDTRRGGMALMEAGTPDPGIFTARSDLVVARGPEWGPDNFKTQVSRRRQYRDPTDNLGFRTVLQVR